MKCITAENSTVHLTFAWSMVSTKCFSVPDTWSNSTLVLQNTQTKVAYKYISAYTDCKLMSKYKMYKK